MLEQWNNGQKTHNFSVWINFNCFSMNVYIGARDNCPFVAIVAFPNEWLSLLFFNQMEHEWSQYSIIPLFHYSSSSHVMRDFHHPVWDLTC